MNATKLMLIITILLIVIYDIIAFYIWGSEGTISNVVWNISLENPIVPFTVGLICGHLFWRE